MNITFKHLILLIYSQNVALLLKWSYKLCNNLGMHGDDNACMNIGCLASISSETMVYRYIHVFL